MEEVTKEELKAILHSFQKDKIPRPDGWTVEFLLASYDIIGHDLLHLVEETRINGLLHHPLNSTFLSLIPKKDKPEILEDYRPISLCNITYKVVIKIIAQRLKKVLSKIISKEQFKFLEDRQIHEAIGVAQEGLHSAKTKKAKGAIFKIDLSKAFDKVSWIYLLTHLGFNYAFIKWVFACITTASFVVLINGATSPFFHSERGLCQGCPLSPLLFLLVVEGLSRALLDAKRRGQSEGLRVATNLNITHLLFVDDILIFCNGSLKEAENLS